MSSLWLIITHCSSDPSRSFKSVMIYYMVSYNSKSKIHNLPIYGQTDPKTAIVICVVYYITAAKCVCWDWFCVRVKRARCSHRLRTSVFQVKTNQGVHRGSISTCRGSVRDLAINIHFLCVILIGFSWRMSKIPKIPVQIDRRCKDVLKL